MIINRAVFIESTISHEEMKPFLYATDLLLPSIKRGQLLDLYSMYPSIKEVIVVDGVFEQYPSITHKEIMWLISKGVQVIGIGSIGALRAYELRNNGMNGYGWVYEQLLNGLIDGDDEVAVAYDPIDPANSKTLAMVNFRKIVVDNEGLTKYLSFIKQIHFRERTWKTLANYLPNNILTKLTEAYVDIKKEDVIQYINSSKQVQNKSENQFVSNVYFNTMQIGQFEPTVLEFIKLRLQKVQGNENSNNAPREEDYKDVCKFLELPPEFSNQIALVLDKLAGIKLSPSKIKTFTVKLQSELNFSSPQAILKMLLKFEIPTTKVKVLFENLTKLFDYFLCTSY